MAEPREANCHFSERRTVSISFICPHCTRVNDEIPADSRTTNFVQCQHCKEGVVLLGRYRSHP